MDSFYKLVKKASLLTCENKIMNIGQLLTLMILLGYCNPGYAAVRNEVGVDAGLLLHELEPERHVLPDPKVPQVDINLPNLTQQGSEDKIFIKRINFSWREYEALKNLNPKYKHVRELTGEKPEKMTKIAEYEVDRLEKAGHSVIDNELGKELTFNELVKLAEAVTLKMRELGYTTALAYLPQQQMEDDTIVMNVMLGTYEDIIINNKSMLADSRIKAMTKKLHKDDLIVNKYVNGASMVLNDMPGIMARSVLQPGNLPGTAQLVVDVVNLEKQGMAVYTDNQGSRSTGRYRYGASYHYNNLAGAGDSLTLNYMTSNLRNMDNYTVQYESSYGDNGAKWRTSFAKMTYDIMSSSKLNYLGKSRTFELGTAIPMERDLFKSSFIDLSYKHRLIEDDIVGQAGAGGSYSMFSSKTADVAEVALKGYTRGKRYSWNYYFINSLGWIRPNSGYEEQRMTASEAARRYTKSYLSLSHIYKLNKYLNLHTSANGQWSWNKNLDSSEDFYIGGPNGVRAFTSGEASGDLGALGTLELRYQTKLPELTLTTFYDLGYVRYNAKELASTVGSNSKTLAAAGVGAIFSSSRDLYMKLDVAFPLSNRFSESYGRNNNFMIWYRLVKQI